VSHGAGRRVGNLRLEVLIHKTVGKRQERFHMGFQQEKNGKLYLDNTQAMYKYLPLKIESDDDLAKTGKPGASEGELIS
jgi:hypothetical protein